jgi:hypothetical protein
MIDFAPGAGARRTEGGQRFPGNDEKPEAAAAEKRRFDQKFGAYSVFC